MKGIINKIPAIIFGNPLQKIQISQLSGAIFQGNLQTTNRLRYNLYIIGNLVHRGWIFSVNQEQIHTTNTSSTFSVVVLYTLLDLNSVGTSIELWIKDEEKIYMHIKRWEKNLYLKTIFIDTQSLYYTLDYIIHIIVHLLKIWIFKSQNILHSEINI